MLHKDKQIVQELLAHPGWDIFRSLVYQDQTDGHHVIRQSLRSKLQTDLLSAGRSGDGIKAAKVTGQIDILDVVLELPGKYLKG